MPILTSYWGVMTSSTWSTRKPLSSSPFLPKPEPTIEVYAVGDQVCHDLYGLGRVVGVEAHAVSVDFGARTVRVTSPYAKMEQL
jgi:hypothetical protein